MQYTLKGTSLSIEIEDSHLKTNWSQLLKLYKTILSESHKSSGFMFFNPLVVTDDDISINKFIGTEMLLIDLNRCKLNRESKGKVKTVKLINLMDWDKDEPYFFFNVDYPHLSRMELSALLEWSALEEDDHQPLKLCV